MKKVPPGAGINSKYRCVSLVDFFEHLLRLRIAGILIWMILEREPAILLLDLLICGAFGNVKELIQGGSGPKDKKKIIPSLHNNNILYAV
jgi:hypothetical protein